MQLFDHKLAENNREKYQSSHEFRSTMIISLLFLFLSFFFLSMTSEFVLNNTHTHTYMLFYSRNTAERVMLKGFLPHYSPTHQASKPGLICIGQIKQKQGTGTGKHREFFR